jgi:tetratricopeptide (TPR) repeat protein
MEADKIYLEILESNPHKNENKFWIFGHLLTLIKNHSQLKEKHYLDNILNEALGLAINNIDAKVFTQRTEIEELIIEYCRLGREREALQIIRNLSNDNIKFKCYILVVKVYLRKGNQEETKLLLEEIKNSLIPSIDDCKRIKRQVSLAGFLIKNKNIVEGNALLNTLLIEAESIENNDERFDILSRIYLRLNQYEKAIECSNAIESNSSKIQAWTAIMANLARNSKVEELKNFVATIISLTDIATSRQNELLKTAAIEFSTIDLTEDALNLCNEISDYSIKSECLLEITRINLANNNKEIATKTLNVAIENAEKIEDEKSNAFFEIAIELILQNRTEEAIKIAESIRVRRIRANCFFDLGSMFRKTNSLKKGIDLMSNITKEDDALHFNYGICRNLESKDSSAENIIDLLVKVAEDQYALMYLLHYHAAYSVFFGDTHQDKIDKLNSTININWMLELTKKPDKDSHAKTHINVGDWINEIQDEDDREEILLNVRKASKGKITEEEFSILLRKILN